MEAPWRRLGAAGGVLGAFLGDSFGQSDGGTGQQNSFLFSPRQVLAGFLAFGWSLGCLFGVFFGRSEVRAFESSLDVRGSVPKFFEKASVVVALCTWHRHFAS